MYKNLIHWLLKGIKLCKRVLNRAFVYWVFRFNLCQAFRLNGATFRDTIEYMLELNGVSSSEFN